MTFYKQLKLNRAFGCKVLQDCLLSCCSSLINKGFVYGWIWKKSACDISLALPSGIEVEIVLSLLSKGTYTEVSKF